MGGGLEGFSKKMCFTDLGGRILTDAPAQGYGLLPAPHTL